MLDHNMVALAATFPDRQILQTLSAKLSWSHFVELLRVEDPLARAFYTELTRLHYWGVRTLREKIRSHLYDRSLLSRQPEEIIAQELALLRDEDRLTVDMVLRGPYLLAGLGLGEQYSEQELENAILREMEVFLLEIGDGFAFVARQKRFPSPASGGKVRELDLLFYHRKLRRLVAFELKVGPFEPEFKGQMEYYLRWLDQNEREIGEKSPIGLILCSEAHPDDITLMNPDQGDIRVARNITENLPLRCWRKSCARSWLGTGSFRRGGPYRVLYCRLPLKRRRRHPMRRMALLNATHVLRRRHANISTTARRPIAFTQMDRPHDVPRSCGAIGQTPDG